MDNPFREKRIKRPLALFASGFMTALAVLCFFMENGGIYAAILSLVAVLVFSLPRFRARYAGRLLLLFAGIFIASLLWMLNLCFVYQPVVSYYGQGGELTGYVRDYPQVYDDYTKLELKAESFSGKSTSRMNVCVYLDGDWGFLEPGDCIRIFTELEIPENSWSFASRRYLNSHGIFLTASSDDAELMEDKQVPVFLKLRRAEKLAEESINAVMPEREAGMMSALIFGDETRLPEGFSQELRASGLSHITAVSGMNVAFLCAVLYTLFGRKVGSVIGIPAVLTFIIMTGCSASVVRAGIMQILLILAYFISREADGVTDLSISALIILLTNPFAIADVGFLLSFFATLGMIVCSRFAEGYIVSHVNIRQRLLQRLVTGTLLVIVQTLSAQLFILPIQILCFHEISLISPLANAAVLWATEYAFTLGVFAAVVGFIWLPLGVIIGFVPRILCAYILRAVPLFASVPYAFVRAESVYIYALLALLYLVPLICILTRYRNIKFTVTVFVFLCVAAFTLSAVERKATASAAVISTVSGQSTVIRDGSEFIVFNAGGSGAYAFSGVDDFLWEQGCREISVLAVSSYRKADIGNIAVALEKYKVKKLLLPEPQKEDNLETFNFLFDEAKKYGVQAEIVREDAMITAGNAEITIYVNHSDDSDSGRLLMKVSVGSKTILSVGAVQPENLGRILYEADYPHADLLAISDYYSQKFIPGALAKLHPQCAVLSAYNGVNVGILDSLSAVGTESYVTNRKGRFVLNFKI